VTPSYWTEADQAELDVLIDAFVKCVMDHTDGCAICSAGVPWCSALEECFQGILDWRRSRALRSKAVWLRAKRMALEERLAA
jgi:hypothetical protein